MIKGPILTFNVRKGPLLTLNVSKGPFLTREAVRSGC
jgi:hypothetical protein